MRLRQPTRRELIAQIGERRLVLVLLASYARDYLRMRGAGAVRWAAEEYERRMRAIDEGMEYSPQRPCLRRRAAGAEIAEKDEEN